MPGCCAFACSNSDSKGFLMKRFPSDPKRRKLWENKVHRDNWNAKDSSYLCEVHFTPECFEQNRADGKRRLKPNAIPTIFSHLPPEKHRKPPTLRSPKEKKELVASVQEPSTSQAAEAQETTSSSSTSCAPSPGIISRTEKKEAKERIQVDISAFLRTSGKNELLKRKLPQQRRKSLVNNVKEGIYYKCLKKVFTDTQIKVLLKGNVKSKIKWDIHTLTNCLKLKFACGTTGYNELLKQNFPLPSHKTLRRHVQGVIFKPRVNTQK